MQTIYIENADEINDVISAQPTSQFLQSWEWGEFNQALGIKVFRLGIKDGDSLIAVTTLFKKTLPIGKSYFYCPRGAVINVKCQMPNAEMLECLFKEIKKLAKIENAIFLRFEPLEKLEIRNYNFGIKRTIDIQASKTLILDIEKSEEELLKAMHQKTRYNIRLAEKKGVIIREASSNDFEEFWEIMEETKNRDGFRLHSKEYYKKMLAINFVKLYLAVYNDKVIAGCIISFFGDMGVYIHGASSNSNRNLMAPYALQWHAIKEAKQKNLKYYDFNGINKDKWPGVTRFKFGFSGREINYPGTYDLIFSKLWYNVYKLIRKIRRSI